MNVTEHDALLVPDDWSVQLPELPNVPPLGEAPKLTVPVGVLAPLVAVSVTVAVHDVALPAAADVGEQPTMVEVGSTMVVIVEDVPLLVAWVLSPW